MCQSLLDATKKITYIDLVNRLTDLEGLAVLPVSGEQCAQWSSYDRRSKYDEINDQYIEWGANDDGEGIIRGENGELVFAEMEGPGVIWRIWSAKAGAGHVKIYLDGKNEPVIDLPFRDYFNGKSEPFTRPALVHQTAKGLNCYIPIPYQKSCKITAEPGWGAYYHFTYANFPKGTVVPIFERELSLTEKNALDQANDLLLNCGAIPAASQSGEITEKRIVQISPGSNRQVIQIDGKYAITSIKVNLDLPGNPEDQNVLRELALSIYWDNESSPSVWAPLGDFFGTAPGVNQYKSFPMGMTAEGFYSNWYMPFAKRAIIRLANEGDKEREVTFSIIYVPLDRPIETLGRFHAKWHRDAFLPDRKDRWPDWTLLTTAGSGRFCGVMLHIWNPKGEWWGEGDEKFFIDGEKFPSTFGTGSEDYFGYAWCCPDLFQNAYHNQTFNSGDNCGHISVNRWQISDNVPFLKSFEGAIEKYFENSVPTLYASTVYWYLASDGDDPYTPVPVGQRIGYCITPPVFLIKDALEAESLTVLGKTSGHVRPQKMHIFGADWSGDTQLWWRGVQPGDVLELAVPVKKAGQYRLEMQLTKAVDYGIIRVRLDGKTVGGPLDLYNAEVIPYKVEDANIHQLSKGQHKLSIEVIGSNPKAIQKYMVGIDYLLLRECD